MRSDGLNAMAGQHHWRHAEGVERACDRMAAAGDGKRGGGAKRAGNKGRIAGNLQAGQRGNDYLVRRDQRAIPVNRPARWRELKGEAARE
jgi:hypothetical protein